MHMSTINGSRKCCLATVMSQIKGQGLDCSKTAAVNSEIQVSCCHVVGSKTSPTIMITLSMFSILSIKFHKSFTIHVCTSYQVAHANINSFTASVSNDFCKIAQLNQYHGRSGTQTSSIHGVSSI